MEFRFKVPGSAGQEDVVTIADDFVEFLGGPDAAKKYALEELERMYQARKDNARYQAWKRQREFGPKEPLF